MGNILDVCSKLSFENGVNAYADYIGVGNIWIDNSYDESVVNLTQYIIYEAINKTAPGQLIVTGYDNDLSGVFAPFASLSSGESKLLELISTEKQLKDYLEYLWQQIQAIQNVMQGRAKSLIDFRKAVNRPIEGYRLIVLSIDMGLIENDMRVKLSHLMRKGPACGITFLIISTTLMSIQTSSGNEVPIRVESIAPNTTLLEVENNIVKINNTKQSARFTPIKAEQIIESCNQFIINARKAQLPVVTFAELHDDGEMWKSSSVNGLTFSIGKYGINNVEITIGDEINQRHNALITGAVGQGKSNLISVIIHSLCFRYSPKELNLYLLDFKEGVTFKPFSNIGQDEYLPHAKALGLESDVSFGIAVLKSLYGEYERRMKLLKEYNYKSIRDLRHSNLAIEMPRIVVVIDEFQMMFGDDMQVGQTVAELLEKSVRLFRAAGIHFILASQTLGGNMALAQKRDSIFSQVPIRIALKNSLSESQQTLSLNNSAAAFLRTREAVVNLDYGEVSQNRKTVIAFADETVLRPLRKNWWEKSKTITIPPYVFESEKRITVQNGKDRIKALRKKSNYPVAIVGDKISVDAEHIELPLSNEPGRNIAIIGTPDGDCNQAVGMIQSIAISLALQNSKGNARFIFCDFESRETTFDKKYPIFNQIMENAGYFVECIQQNDFEITIKQLSSETGTDELVYVFGLALDKWEFEKDPYGQGSSLKTFVESAPSKNMHFIGWWVKASNYTSQVSGYGSSDAFNSKIFLRIDERAVQSLTNPFVKWTAQNNRALISDSVEFSDEMQFIPYSPVDAGDLSAIKSIVWN